MAANIKLSDCLIAPHRQPCWDCANACGGCEWSSKFQPVPGWDASPVIQKFHGGGTPRDYLTGSYAIRACPKFRRG